MNPSTKYNMLELLVISTFLMLQCTVVSATKSENITGKNFEDVAFIAPSGKVVAKWVPVSTGGKILLSRQQPVGLEDGNSLYLCRGKVYDNRDKPGKLVLQDGNYFCSIPEYGQVRRKTFELLETPAGATSWVNYRNRIPNNAVTAGNHPHGGTAYICRTKNGDALLVGALDGNACFVPRGSEEHVIWSDSNNIEIFVVNAYGLSL